MVLPVSPVTSASSFVHVLKQFFLQVASYDKIIINHNYTNHSNKKVYLKNNFGVDGFLL